MKSENSPSDASTVFADGIVLPAASLVHSRLDNNIRWMQEFADLNSVKLAPHGKTTMAPELFQRQMDAGAWAICVGTAEQAVNAHAAGINRILMPNQLVGRGNMGLVSDILETCEYYCLIDSEINALQLDEYFSTRKQTVSVLIELGVEGGRCGCRSIGEAMQLAEFTQALTSVRVVGVEFYEGVIHGNNSNDRVRELVVDGIVLAKKIGSDPKFRSKEVIVSGAGSVWYDVVTETFQQGKTDCNRLTPVIRPGCYVTHDDGIYANAQDELLKRNVSVKLPNGALESCLEVWALVHSRPEPDRVIVGLGKRDVAFDAGLPKAKLRYRSGMTRPQSVSGCWETVDIMDHHTFLQVDTHADVEPGDIIAFSTSHPCLTFDKWKKIFIVDDDYSIVDQIRTAF